MNNDLDTYLPRDVYYTKIMPSKFLSNRLKFTHNCNINQHSRWYPILLAPRSP